MSGGDQDSQAGVAFKFNSATSGGVASDQKIVNTTSLMAAATQFTSLVTFSQTSWVSNSVVWNLGLDGPNNPYYSLTSATNFLFQAGAGTGISAPIVSDSVFTAVGTYDASIGTNGLMSLWMNGAKAGTFSPTVGPINIGSGGYALGCSVGNSYYALKGSIYRHLLFNYVLSESKIKRYSAGAKLDFDDIGGSMTSMITGADSTFSAGYTWSLDSLVTINAGSNDKLVFAAATSGSGAYKNSFLTKGKRYRIRFTIDSITTSNTIGLYSVDVTVTSRKKDGVALTADYIADSAGTWEFECIAGGSGGLGARLLLMAISTTATAQVDNFTITPLGCVLDLEPESATPSTWHDESGNQLDGAVTGATLVDVPHFANTDYGRSAVIQELQDNSADKPSYAFTDQNAAGSQIVLVADSDQLSFGNGTTDSPFTMLSVGRLTTAGLSKASNTFMAKWDEYSTQRFEYWMKFSGSGKTLACGLIDTSASAFQSRSIPLNDTNIHSFCGVYDGRGGSSANEGISIYVDGVKGVSTNTSSGGTYAAMENTTATLGIGAVRGAAGPTTYIDALNGQMFRSILFNYALDETKIRRYSAGAKLDYEDVGGNMQIVGNGSFSSDATSWAVSGGTATLASVAGGLPTGNCLQITWASGTSQTTYQVVIVVPGKRYRMSAWYKAGTGATTITIRVNDAVGSGQYYGNTTRTATGTWQQTPFVEFTAVDTAVTMEIVTDLVSGTILVDEVVISQLGAVLDLEPENIYSDKWIDASPNGLHGTVSGALSTNVMPAARLGRTDGAAIPAGYIGECIGTEIAGTGGKTYRTTTATAITGTSASVVSYTLNKGTYLVTLSSDGYSNSASGNVELYVKVGGTTVTSLIRALANTSGYHGTITLPIVITTDGTAVSLWASSAISVTVSAHEIYILRVA